MYGLDRFSVFVDKRPLNYFTPSPASSPAGSNQNSNNNSSISSGSIPTMSSRPNGGGGGNSSSLLHSVNARRARQQQQQQQNGAFASLPKLRLNEYNLCNYVTRNNYAIFSSHIHLQCNKPLMGRYIYIQADGRSNRWSRIFSAVLCEIQVYEL
jgi:hypothetical protein